MSVDTRRKWWIEDRRRDTHRTNQQQEKPVAAAFPAIPVIQAGRGMHCWVILGLRLAYADDIDIIGLQLSYVVEAYQQIERAANILGLQIKDAKTKLMAASSAVLPIKNPNLRRRDVQIGERTFEVVPQFTYLGSKVSNDNSMEAELRARMLAANRSFYSLKNQLTL